MRTAVTSAIILFSLFTLAGCKPKATCSGPDSIELVGQILSDGAEKTLAEQKKDDGTPVFDPASVRATLSKILITVENIRTTKEDPNSTRVSCEGSAKLVIPADILKQAEEGRELMTLGKMSDYAKTNSIAQSANSFTKTIEYSVQPTDDGKKIFAELTAPKPLADFLGEIAASSLLKPLVETSRIEQSKALEAEKQRAAQQEQQLQLQQKEESLNKAREDNLRANQTIDEVWKNIPDEQRKPMLDAQREWIKKKDLDCTAEASSRSSDPSEMETLRLNCETAVTDTRIEELRRPAG